MKTSNSFDLVVPPQPAGTTAYEWLYAAIREQILSGRLRPGLRLPATREVARQLGLARGTVMNAIDQLKAEGYLSATVGSGTYVAAVLPDSLQRVAAPISSRTRPAVKLRKVSEYAKRLRVFTGYSDQPTRAFRCNLPALEMFPIELWVKISSKRVRSFSPRALMGPHALGYGPLREAIADYLVRSRGVHCTAEQIAVVAGVQEALDLVGKLLINPGDRVCMEDPGYPGAELALQALGAKLARLPIDSEGMTLHRTAMRGARLVYVTPAHQFPTGVSMSLARRMEWIEWAAQNRAVIFEDDYDGEFRYSSRPLPSMQGLDRYGCVVFAGSFSKVLFPSLRLGYVVVPPDLVERVEAAISLTTRHAPMLDQAVLCDFMSEGHFARHLRRMREVYAERLGALQDAVRVQLQGSLELSEIHAGLQTTGWLTQGTDGEQVSRLLSKRDVQTTPLSEYARRPLVRDGLQLGFAAVNPREIRRGVTELAKVLESLQKVHR